jgi:hypothetical protein
VFLNALQGLVQMLFFTLLTRNIKSFRNALQQNEIGVGLDDCDIWYLICICMYQLKKNMKRSGMAGGYQTLHKLNNTDKICNKMGWTVPNFNSFEQN